MEWVMSSGLFICYLFVNYVGAFFNPKHGYECQGKMLLELPRALAAYLKAAFSFSLIYLQDY